MTAPSIEYYLVVIAMTAYLAGWLPALINFPAGDTGGRLFMAGILAGLLLHGGAIVLRWVRLGHGPFIHLHEILSSNIWSLTVIYLVFFLCYPQLRRSVSCVAPVPVILICWLLMVEPADVPLPPTYDTVWLYFHVLFGKVFLGVLLIATGLAGVILLRRVPAGRRMFLTLPGSDNIDLLCYRFVSLALILDSLMLIAGAIWAQDAWGRYWAWDPLETWAFLTWLWIAASLHLRLVKQLPRWVSALLVVAAFGIAFMTFFGVPFLSRAPHKGMI